jgi:nitrite reductase (NADH) small subunit
MTAPAPTYPLGRLDEIPLGEGRVFRVDGRDIAVFRCRDGEVHATDAACPHRGGPLADGLVGDGTVVCPLHGCVFDLRTGTAKGRDCHRLAVMRVTVSPAGELALDVS